MGYARSHTIAAEEAGAYHLMARCVRRAYLCGDDPVSGKNFDHRKQWLEDRILEISQFFAIDVYAYAVMSNHYHIVVWADPRRVDNWTDDQVADRWLALFPPRFKGEIKRSLIPLAAQRLIEDPHRIDELRRRLGSVSWFMRLINEPLARRSNAEDQVRGRFWESRFKSQALLDQVALLSCMAYVDLNPIRAQICDRPEHARHTSIGRRIAELQQLIDGDRSQVLSAELMPIDKEPKPSIAAISVRDYLDLVDWTGRIVRDDKAGVIVASAPQALQQLGMDAGAWQHMLGGYKDPGWAIGSLESLIRQAHRVGKRWLKGMHRIKIDYSPPLNREQ